MRFVHLALMVPLVGGVGSAVAQPVPVGNEFQVNTYTTGYQGSHSVSLDADGDFVVVWMSLGQFGAGGAIVGQRFAADGTPQGGEFQVSAYTNSQSLPSVSLNTDGDFVVVWSSYGQDGSGNAIEGQRFAADGTPQGGEFQVNTYTTGPQNRPSVSLDADGDFVVVWESFGQDGDGSAIEGQRFAADGTPQGGEFQVNTYTTYAQYGPSVSLDDDGDFVVVWTSYGQDGSSHAIEGQRFAADGTPQGGEFQVNSYTTSSQYGPSVSLNADGDFVVVWQSYGQDGSLWAVEGQRFAADGTPQGGEFQVNTYTANYQDRPSVSLDADGDFVVVWQSDTQDGSAFAVEGQRFAADGTPQGGEFQVNTYTTNSQYRPSVSLAAGGDFVVVWDSNGQDGSGLAVESQRFAGPPAGCTFTTPLFADSFLSGDTSEWDVTRNPSNRLVVDAVGQLDADGFGMRVDIDTTADKRLHYVTTSHADVPNYCFSFLFDPNDLVMPGNRLIKIAGAQGNDNRRLLDMTMRGDGAGGYSVRLRAFVDGGGTVSLPFVPITNGPTLIHGQWVQTSGPGNADGELRIWIDGIEAAANAMVDDVTRLLRTPGMGNLGLSRQGTVGEIFFDGFVAGYTP